MSKKKRGQNSHPKKLEKASNDTFVVTHDDGSAFEVKVDPRKAKIGTTRISVTMGDPCFKCGSKWHSDCSNDSQ